MCERDFLVFHEEQKQIELESGEVDFFVGAAQSPMRDIQLEIAGAQDSVFGVGLHAPTPQHRAHARNHFAEAERRRDTVVRARIEGGQIVPWRASGTYGQYSEIGKKIAQLTADCDGGPARQSQVEQHELKSTRVRGRQNLFRAGRLLQTKTGRGQ